MPLKLDTRNCRGISFYIFYLITIFFRSMLSYTFKLFDKVWNITIS